jgi:hypothetical protein
VKKLIVLQIEACRVTETCAEVKLQNYTVTRLLTYLEKIVQNLSNEESDSLLLLCKWGCDGSQQTQYKQTFQNNCNSGSNIFQSSFVPLQLICQLNKKLIRLDIICDSDIVTLKISNEKHISQFKMCGNVVGEKVGMSRNVCWMVFRHGW